MDRVIRSSAFLHSFTIQYLEDLIKVCSMGFHALIFGLIQLLPCSKRSFWSTGKNKNVMTVSLELISTVVVVKRLLGNLSPPEGALSRCTYEVGRPIILGQNIGKSDIFG